MLGLDGSIEAARPVNDEPTLLQQWCLLNATFGKLSHHGRWTPIMQTQFNLFILCSGPHSCTCHVKLGNPRYVCATDESDPQKDALLEAPFNKHPTRQVHRQVPPKWIDQNYV